MKLSKLSMAIQGAIVCAPLATLAATPIEEIIVTGTASGGEMRKLDASFAITNVSSEDIERFSPQSTADLLKSVPGIWAESSGGVAGANVFVRGFPSTGDAPFLTVQLEGAPVFPAPTLSFLENTTLFRIDETVERMEGLRGGPQSVQDNGQPGLTTNFILKEGDEVTEGVVKYSTSDYDLQRFDAMMSGPLSDDLFYMIGGYVTSSPGIRDAGYTAEKGEQFTIKLTKRLEQGDISVYHRQTDDHGTWYLPGALNVPGADSEYTQVGTFNRKGTILAGPDGEAEVRSVDLADGRGWDGSISGVNFNLEISEHWTLSNNLNYTTGDADTLGLVPEGGAVNLAALMADPTLDPSAVITGPVTGSVTGNPVSGSAYIQQFGLWEVRKDIESYTNNLAFTGTYEKFDLTVGYYTANTSVEEFWSLGNQDYYVVESGGEKVMGIACNEPDVDSCTWNYDIDASGDVKSNAFYGVFAYHVTPKLTLDVGVRREDHEVDYTVDEGLTGSISKFVRYDETETSYTAGANYDLSENQGVFARASRGYKFPYFDDFRDNFDAFQSGDPLIQEVTQLELGYKLGLDNLSAYLTLFGNEIEGNNFVAVPGGPVETFTNEAYGLEVDAAWYHESGFTMKVNATIQETEITESPDNVGNEAQRQPPYQVRLSPSYDLEFSEDFSATFYGTLSVVDDRYSDNANTVVLDGYEKLDIGVIMRVGEHLTLQLAGDNITDEDGLTEGDPRNPAAPNGRFIMPRSYKLSVGYNF